ncbi:MAG: efflux RND transporter periplasmic adaptor subunit [Legionella sp.]
MMTFNTIINRQYIYNMMMLFIICITLVGCHHKKTDTKSNLKSYTVQPIKIHKRLTFTGLVQPLSESTITSPVNAFIEASHCQYGQLIKTGDVVFTLNSTELQKQYNDILTDYLRSKDSYGIAQAKFSGTQELWQAGLLSKNNYLSEQSSLNNARVSLMQATQKLSEMLEKMGEENDPNLSSLSFETFDKVRLALNSKHNLLHLKAPTNGVLLYPPKSTDDKNGHLTVGSAVKADQVLALIGDLSGIRVDIDVPEVDINKIYTGMRASIRNPAFSEEELQGRLVAINAQASISNGSNLPSFTAIIEVKNLNPSQRRQIKIGMSALVEIFAESQMQLTVPITAVKLEQGHAIVFIRQADHSLKKTEVITGDAEADRVVIKSGLTAGDTVVYE